jgi:predicted patatin/cPLA2 family phospholipase
MRKEKRLLIVGSGGLRGAYGAGVLTKISEKFGPNYFNDILACSAGSYSASYYMAGQIKDMEYIWKNLLDADKFVTIVNKFKGKQILNLDYLHELMTKSAFKLNIDKIIKSKTKLKYTLTEYKTGNIVFIEPKRNNVYDLIKGSAAVYPLYPPVKINKKEYVDGAFNEPIPFDFKFVKKYDKILIIQNVNQTEKEEKMFALLLRVFSYLAPEKIDRMINRYTKSIEAIRKATKYENVLLLTPSQKIPLKTRFDANKKRIIATFNLGLKDAQKAIKFLEK